MLTITNVTWLDLLCLAGVTVGVYLIKQTVIKKNPAPYPPGPREWPLISNFLDMPRIKPRITFTEWGKKYGDITHIEVLGRHIIVLNSVKTAMDMMDSKSTLYSDRPVLPMAGELQRKNLHRVIGSRAAVNVYNEIEEVETRRFLKCVLVKPDRLQEHIRYTVGAVILRISHGYEVKEKDDPFVDLANRVLTNASQALAPGAFIVDIIPFLAKVPAWFPGAGFKRIACEWRAALKEMASAPHQFVKDQMVAGIAPVSFTSNLLEGSGVSAEEDYAVKWSALSLYAGGTDTTVSAIYSLFLAMTLSPDVQKKAQAEIDVVVGPDRLPTFADRDSLPYTDALVKEVLRWHVVSPTGLPHCVTEDDIHDGYYIPKGSLVIPNIWFMLNDPRTYANPSQFNPERFLAKDGKEPEMEPRTACFGFVRRICPGLHLADASIWITTAMSLAVFDISKVVEHGVEVTPDIDQLPGSTSHLKPFKCSIKPRSTTALGLIEQ
ncbi:cytochrome P450 [Suillus fuscotomentosus]|uniref:Cytochrome P450 n=1 Tax=Suillus fuscotomentosus TaxID=1912939 RepID=A0AAD4DUX6_9AGAM|nr:cytochrome P450 [Suillus fuscotomentosus]KAG1894332.1 cytochrome P450 [Suillus fuscotomentosus]